MNERMLHCICLWYVCECAFIIDTLMSEKGFLVDFILILQNNTYKHNLSALNEKRNEWA